MCYNVGMKKYILTDRERLLLKLKIDKRGCWIWYGQKNESGYGVYRRKGAHRAVYEEFIGTIPLGLELDHLCKQKNCVNPNHLEPVTRAENMSRVDFSNHGKHLAEAQRRKTHCPQGHPYIPENIYYEKTPYRGGIARRCKICQNAKSRKYYLKKQGENND